MSYPVKYSSLSQDVKDYVNTNLVVEIVDEEYGNNSYKVVLFKADKKVDEVYLPMRFRFDPILEGYNDIIRVNTDDRYEYVDDDKLEFKRGLLENETRDQKTVFIDACKTLEKYGSTLLALRTGFGKTDIAINFIRKYRLKTVMITYANDLKKQFRDRVYLISYLRVQILKNNMEVDQDADIYIMSPCIFEDKEYWGFQNIGILIVDEAHKIATQKYFTFLRCFCPKYCIALTATPDKSTINEIPRYYFGHKNIIRKESNKVRVFNIKTGIKPKIEYNMMGKPNWETVLKSLFINMYRNIIILQLLERFKKYHILVLSKRVFHCDIIEKMLKDKYKDDDSYIITKHIGKSKSYNKKANVIISNYKKFSEGIDNEYIDAVCMILPTKDIRQAIGRIRINENSKHSVKTIFDLVDLNGMCYNQYLNRRKSYIEAGNVYDNDKNVLSNKTKIKTMDLTKIIDEGDNIIDYYALYKKFYDVYSIYIDYESDMNIGDEEFDVVYDKVKECKEELDLDDITCEYFEMASRLQKKNKRTF